MKSRPGGETETASKSLDRICGQSNGLPGHQRHEPLDAEDRADLAVLEAAAARGYRLATWCLVCGRVLSSRDSLRAHVGPVCRTKAVEK